MKILDSCGTGTVEAELDILFEHHGGPVADPGRAHRVPDPGRVLRFELLKMMKKAGLDFGQEWSGIDPETIESDLRGRAIDGSGVRVKGKIMGARAFRKIGLWEEEHMAAWDDVPSNFSKYYKEPPRFLLMMALHVELGEDRDELAEMLGIRADPEATRKHPRKDKSEDKRRRKKT